MFYFTSIKKVISNKALKIQNLQLECINFQYYFSYFGLECLQKHLNFFAFVVVYSIDFLDEFES